MMLKNIAELIHIINVSLITIEDGEGAGVDFVSNASLNNLSMYGSRYLASSVMMTPSSTNDILRKVYYL